MAFIGALELQEARAAVAATLDGTCSWVRSSTVPDGHGGTTTTEVTVGTDRPCRYHAGVPSEEQPLADRYVEVQAVTLVLEWGEDLQVGDVVTLDNGDVVEVAGLRHPGVWDLAVRALCEKRGG